MDGTKKKLAAGAVAVAALAGGGAALAAGGLGSEEEQQAVIDDAAKRLGVEPEALENALEGALGARLDEAVKQGRLTAEQAAELKEHLKDGTLPLFGGREVTCGFTGAYSADGAEVNGTALVGKTSVVFHARLKLCSEF